MGKAKVKFQAGVKGKEGISINLVITGLANLSNSLKNTRYVTTTGIYLENFSMVEENRKLKTILLSVEKLFLKKELDNQLGEITREDIRNIIAEEMQTDASRIKRNASDKNLKRFVGKNDIEYFAKIDSFFDCLKLYIETKGGYYLSINNNDVKEGTLKDFRSLETHIKTIKKDLLISEIDQAFLNKIEKYFNTLSKSSYVKYLKSFKRVLKFAAKRKIGLSESTFYEEIKPDLSNIEEVQTENIFTLSKKELKQFYTFKSFDKISNPVKAEISRDIFIFLCMTGVRISDLQAAKKFNVEGIEQISFIAKKTDAVCNIPLNKTALEIINKYASMPFKGANKGLLPAIADQAVNDNLKEIGKALNWNDQTPLCTMKTSDTKKKMDQTELKYNRLMTKVGRKTFATLLDDEGFEGPAQIMMGYKPKGMFHKHYSDKKKMMPKLLKAVKTLEIK